MSDRSVYHIADIKTIAMTQKERYNAVIERFSKEMPAPRTELHYDSPYQLLVAVILSAQCTDKRINMVTPAIFRDFPTAADMAASTQEQLFEYVKSVSYLTTRQNHSSAWRGCSPRNITARYLTT